MAHPSISALRSQLRLAERRGDKNAAAILRAKLKAAEKQRGHAARRGESRAAAQSKGQGRNRSSAEYKHHLAKAKDKRLSKAERLKHSKMARAIALALFVPGAAPFVVVQAERAKALRRRAQLARQRKNYAAAQGLDEQAKKFETNAESYQYDPEAPRTAARESFRPPGGPGPSRVSASPLSTRRPQIADDEADTSEDSTTELDARVDSDTGIAGTDEPWYKRYALPLALAAGVGALVAFGGKGRSSSSGAATLRVKTSTVKRVRKAKSPF